MCVCSEHGQQCVSERLNILCVANLQKQVLFFSFMEVDKSHGDQRGRALLSGLPGRYDVRVRD